VESGQHDESECGRSGANVQGRIGKKTPAKRGRTRRIHWTQRGRKKIGSVLRDQVTCLTQRRQEERGVCLRWGPARICGAPTSSLYEPRACGGVLGRACHPSAWAIGLLAGPAALPTLATLKYPAGRAGGHWPTRVETG